MSFLTGGGGWGGGCIFIKSPDESWYPNTFNLSMIDAVIAFTFDIISLYFYLTLNIYVRIRTKSSCNFTCLSLVSGSAICLLLNVYFQILMTWKTCSKIWMDTWLLLHWLSTVFVYFFFFFLRPLRIFHSLRRQPSCRWSATNRDLICSALRSIAVRVIL